MERKKEKEEKRKKIKDPLTRRNQMIAANRTSEVRQQKDMPRYRSMMINDAAPWKTIGRLNTVQGDAEVLIVHT